MSRSNFRITRMAVATLFTLLVSLPAFSDSQVRIVRLSYISGSVQIDRLGRSYEKALLNLPIAEGTKLKTADDGRAEVEFEDSSTLRLAPNSVIVFSQLSLRDSGDKTSAVEVRRGTVYVNFAGTKDNELMLQFDQEKIQMAHAAHMRIAVGVGDATVAVFKGDIQIDGSSGVVAVKKNQTANFDLADNSRYTLAKNIEEQPFDAWDKQQDQYHVRYTSKSYNSYSPYAYGTQDLAYYGNFFNAPGYGMMWQPYFAGTGWDPFMDGAWAFSPGFGFGWVSAYPWGWTPYHYGTWVFLPGNGWAWQPGGVWTTWNAHPRLLNAPAGFSVPLVPTMGTHTVLVNRGPVSTASGSKLLVRNNSAGLGVPRGEISNPGQLSQRVQQRGAATERVHPAPVIFAASPASRNSESNGGRPLGPSRESRAPQPPPTPMPSSAPASTSSHHR